MKKNTRSHQHQAFILVFLCLLYISGCSQTPALEKLAADAVILSFGDSLTYGTGANTTQSYPVVLEKLTGLRVVGSGIPGETTVDGLKRLSVVIQEHQPELLIICHGGNDFLKKIDPAATHQNLIAMINLAKQQGIQVVLLGVPKPGLFLSTADIYHTISKEAKIPLEADIIPDILSDKQYKSDPIHPNAEGYTKIAHAVHRLLIKNGAIHD